MLSCLVGNNRINCYDGEFTKDELKKWSKKGILICPACGKPYEYCHGKVMIPYFRHKDKVECEDKYSEIETEEHLKGKKDLYEWIKCQEGVSNVILEGWIPETKQRPDIMFKCKDLQYVIEYQCSPIATEYYERHDLYKAAGINDIWICGTEKYFQYYHKGNGNKRVNILEDECKLYYDSNIKLFFLTDFIEKEKEYNRICKIGVDTNNLNKCAEGIYKYNYYFIKDKDNSYTSYSIYPSGKRSNKYRYPVVSHSYCGNKSLARYFNTNDFKLKNVISEGF